MKKHEKLKTICDKIGYYIQTTNDNKLWIKYSEANNWYSWEFYKRYVWQKEVDVREIIFTQAFIDKFANFTAWEDTILEFEKERIMMMMCNELDHPVDYLYNLIKD